MPKKTITRDTITRDEVIEIVKQAEAAANVPELTPIENQAIDQPAMDTKPSTSDSDLSFNRRTNELNEDRTNTRNQILITEERLKSLKSLLKEQDEEYIAHIQSNPKFYKQLQQEIFNF